MFKRPLEDRRVYFIALATVLTGFLGFPLILMAFSLNVSEGLSTLIIGAFLIVVAFINKGKKMVKKSRQPDIKSAVLPGFVQGLAALPGFSRSGLTTSALLFEGFSLEDSLKLSFLMGIPVILGAQIALPIVGGNFQITLPLIVGGFSSFLVGSLTIKKLMEFAKKTNFFRATLILGAIVILMGFGLLM